MAPLSRNVLDLASQLDWGRLCRTPFHPGIWAVLEPAGVQNHAPQLCWIGPDTLACVWMAGGQEGTAGMSIMLSLLDQKTGCWSSPNCVSQDAERSEQNPLLFLTEAGLQLIHSAQRARDLKDQSWQGSGSSFSMQWTAALRHQHCSIFAMPEVDSPALGDVLLATSWSKAVDLLPQPAFCRNPPYRRSDGCWLLPIYRSLEEGGAFGHDHSQVLLLEADGQPTNQIFEVPESKGRVHGSIVPSADGSRLLQFFRSRLADRIYLSTSTIDGEEWSVPQPIDLPNNNSSIQAVRLASGRLAMIFNRFGLEVDASDDAKLWGEANWPRTRWPLAIALSEDDGASWPWIRDIDSGWGFCGNGNWHLNGQLAYPTLLEGPAASLHLAYSWAGRTAIRYVCLEEEEILGLTKAQG